MNRPSDDFWRFLGIGLMVFFICIGLGTCTLLISINEISIPG